jgi:hypothetical protein
MAEIVHGTYRTETVAGFVADFCPVCRDIGSFQVIRVGDASHVAFVSLGQGRLAGHLLRCVQCGTGRGFLQERYAAVAEKNPGTAALIELTHPNIRSEFGERLELETRLRNDPFFLSAPQREQMLLEPFQELDPELEQLDKGTLHQKTASMWGFLVMCAVLGGGGVIIRFEEEKIGWVIGAAIVAFLAVWAGILIRAEGRGIRQRIMPNLARALRPLRPTKEELQMILTRCRNAGLRSGKKVKLHSLWNALEAASFPHQPPQLPQT